ncbi:MAG TPA: YnbE family lipoprotein [Novosphingobium sp.]|nr:YnbE family lipoprotein [Novosphingobium sp.]
MQLTDRAEAANIKPSMVGQERSRWRPALPVVGAVALVAGLAACVSVKAPDKPIVIELNINIRQEVIYRLAEDADKTINENADIF